MLQTHHVFSKLPKANPKMVVRFFSHKWTEMFQEIDKLQHHGNNQKSIDVPRDSLQDLLHRY